MNGWIRGLISGLIGGTFQEGTMRERRGIQLSDSTITGLSFIHKYRFLTISQFAAVTGYSLYHGGELLRGLEKSKALGFFGFTSIPGQGKTPKVYFLRKKG